MSHEPVCDDDVFLTEPSSTSEQESLSELALFASYFDETQGALLKELDELVSKSQTAALALRELLTAPFPLCFPSRTSTAFAVMDKELQDKSKADILSNSVFRFRLDEISQVVPRICSLLQDIAFFNESNYWRVSVRRELVSVVKELDASGLLPSTLVRAVYDAGPPIRPENRHVRKALRVWIHQELLRVIFLEGGSAILEDLERILASCNKLYDVNSFLSVLQNTAERPAAATSNPATNSIDVRLEHQPMIRPAVDRQSILLVNVIKVEKEEPGWLRSKFSTVDDVTCDHVVVAEDDDDDSDPCARSEKAFPKVAASCCTFASKGDQIAVRLSVGNKREQVTTPHHPVDSKGEYRDKVGQFHITWSYSKSMDSLNVFDIEVAPILRQDLGLNLDSFRTVFQQRSISETMEAGQLLREALAQPIVWAQDLQRLLALCGNQNEITGRLMKKRQSAAGKIMRLIGDTSFCSPTNWTDDFRQTIDGAVRQMHQTGFLCFADSQNFLQHLPDASVSILTLVVVHQALMRCGWSEAAFSRTTSKAFMDAVEAGSPTFYDVQSFFNSIESIQDEAEEEKKAAPLLPLSVDEKFPVSSLSSFVRTDPDALTDEAYELIRQFVEKQTGKKIHGIIDLDSKEFVKAIATAVRNGEAVMPNADQLLKIRTESDAPQQQKSGTVDDSQKDRLISLSDITIFCDTLKPR